MLLTDLAMAASINAKGERLVKKATTRIYRTAILSLSTCLEGQVEKFEELTPAHIEQWQEWLKSENPHLTTRSANSYRRSLSTVLKRMGREDLAKPIKQLREPARRSRAINDEHLEIILAHATVRDAAMIMLIRDSGIRRGAIPTIRKENLLIWEGAEGDLRLATRTIQKGDVEILALAGHQCAQMVQMWLSIQPRRNETSYVFTTDNGTPIHVSTITGIFQALKRSTRLPREANIFPHALRHRFAIENLKEHDAKVVSQWMGHADVATTLQIYGHRSEEQLIEEYFGERGRFKV